MDIGSNIETLQDLSDLHILDLGAAALHITLYSVSNIGNANTTSLWRALKNLIHWL